MKKVLFICSGNKQRSKTADDLFSKSHPNIEFKSAGTNLEFCKKIGTTPLSEDMLKWADIIFLMEDKHKNQINAHVGDKYDLKMNVLDIQDVYQYNDKNLIELLKSKVVL
jgi:predicted protein tyrosine phosphatase